MDINYIASADTYIVVHNNVDYYACILAPAGSYTTTGQPYMQEFTTFAEAQAVFGDKITDPTITD